MAVVVTTASRDVVAHDAGGYFYVQDGHLIICPHISQRDQVVAIYAPGHWKNAVHT